MEQINPFKETFLLGSFNVILPTVDVYSDVALMTRLYSNGHPGWATLLLCPVLTNYSLSWITWFNTERQKKFTWLAPLLGCYPQLVAARVIWLVWTKPSEGMREKRLLERNLIESEIFTEAIPTTMVMVFIMTQARGEEDSRLIFGDFNLFVVTFLTSLLTTGLGLAKCLKVGPCFMLSIQIVGFAQSCSHRDIRRWGHVGFLLMGDVWEGSLLQGFTLIMLSLFREAPLRKLQGLFGHCPNSDRTPSPSLKRALWGTLFLGRYE